MKNTHPRIIFFGSSTFSTYVLRELESAGLSPILSITSARDSIDLAKLRELNPDVFVVASFGKILPDELIYLPPKKTLNVHPSLLPRLRGPAPIQGAILKEESTGVSIMRLDDKMDHGPLLAQVPVDVSPWPDHYALVEEKLGSAGGKLLAEVLIKWVNDEIEEKPQEESEATYTKMVKKEDGLIDLQGDPHENLRKVLAYSTWPGAHIFFKKKNGQEIRIVIKDAKIEDGKFVPTRIIPEGKREMIWLDFLRSNA